MQFAGQRTDMDLNPIGEPDNILIRLAEDVLPDPGAILVTGITPQQTIMEGITELEFLKIFNSKIASPGTVFLGYNTLRFDDEFIRAINYRNFFDPYRWHWEASRARWDLLDLVRMTRALRPEGIKWPVNEEGYATNRLELIAKLNGLEHTRAHDALSDVLVTIKLAQLIKEKQPKLFDYLYKMSDKTAVSKLVNSSDIFVYTSGKYPSEYQKTTLVAKLTDHMDKSGKADGALVYDLRVNPEQFADMTVQQIVEAWRWKDKEDKSIRLPVKTLKYNRCPAIAPLEVITGAQDSQQILERLQLDIKEIDANKQRLQAASGLAKKVQEALVVLDKEQDKRYSKKNKHVDEQIYDGFFSAKDNSLMNRVHNTGPENLADFAREFSDSRLKELLPLYKARNFPEKLTSEERQTWEDYLKAELMDGGQNSKLAQFFKRLEEVSSGRMLSKAEQSLIEDLDLYGQSLIIND